MSIAPTTTAPSDTALAPGVIWTALPVPAFLLALRDGQEVILDCNPAAELFLSTSAAVITGKPIFKKLVVDTPILDATTRARNNRAPVFINDAQITPCDKPPSLCHVQIAPVNDAAETLLLTLSPRDIAGRLGHTRMVKAAAKSAIGMADMLAHEIKNPLAGIAGAAQLLSMGLPPEDQELTNLIVAETRRIVKLLEQVEHFGDQRPPERNAVNIHDILERARRSAEVGFGAHMTIRDEYDPSLPDVHADPDQLLQVFLNILKNASESQPHGGQIRIRSYFERGLNVRGLDGRRVALPLHVEIIDDGPGLPPHIADNVFEPFVSGRENGTGLGLALVSKIIAAHEGWIEVNSRPGKTVFRLSLPISAPPVAPNTPSKEVS